MEKAEIQSMNDRKAINDEPKMKLGKVLSYSTGDFGVNLGGTLIGTFGLLYFTSVVGLDAAIVGLIIMFSRILDGFSDVAMGMIIDRTKSKMGKTRFWMTISIVPTMICTFGLFNIPAGFSTPVKYIYLGILYVVQSVIFFTMYNISYSTMVSYITSNKNTRVRLSTFRFFFSIIGSISLSFLTASLVSAFGSGQTGWTTTSLIYSLVAFMFMLLPIVFLRELPHLSNPTVDGQPKKNDPILTSLRVAGKNKYFIMQAFRTILGALAPGILGASGVFYATYVLNNANMLGILTMASFLPMLFTMPLVPALSKKFKLVHIAGVGIVVSILGGALMFFSGQNFTMLLIGLVVYAAGLGPSAGTGGALNSELAEYSKMTQGKDITGIVFSISSVASKVGSGVSAGIVGGLLSLSGYVGTAAVQSAETVTAIRLIYTLPLVIFMIINCILTFSIKVEDTNEKLRAEQAK